MPNSCEHGLLVVLNDAQEGSNLLQGPQHSLPTPIEFLREAHMSLNSSLRHMCPEIPHCGTCVLEDAGAGVRTECSTAVPMADLFRELDVCPLRHI